MGGVASNFIFGNVLDAYKVAGELARGYEIVFAISSSLHILAFLLILATVRRVEPIRLNSQNQPPTAPGADCKAGSCYCAVQPPSMEKAAPVT